MVKEYKYTEIRNNYDVLMGKKIVIWCRSISALNLYIALSNRQVSVIGFTDSYVNKKGETFAGLPVYSIQEVIEMEGAAIYIATNNYRFKQEILEEISKYKGIEVFVEGLVFGAGLYDIEKMKNIIRNSEEKIQYVKDLLGDEKSKKTFKNLLDYRITNDIKLIPEIYESDHMQYFPKDGLFKQEANEIFIDAGAYNGATACNFCEWAGNGGYSKIYALEPDSLMFQIMKEYMSLKNIEKVVPVNGGAYSYSGKLRFTEDSLTGSSRIDEVGEKKIDIVSIDDIVGDDKVTFIKMDIEGAEMAALEGAEKTIERCRPKLAISIYHNENDLWEIPYYILSKYPWYKIFIRHYSLTTNETIMYAAT